VGPVEPGTPPIEDEDENDKVLRTLSGAITAARLAFPPKIFVWQRGAVTVFLRDHRENELNPNPWFKA